MPGLAVHDRIAGAPISWGVSEAPGWGHELAADRVLAEMAGLGLRATELGPTGYLGTTGAEVRARLDGHGLQLIGGFLPVPLHVRPEVDLSEAEQAIAVLAAAGAQMVVLAARSADGSYDRKVALGDGEWAVLLGNLDRLLALIEGYGMRATLHPHVGTAIESGESVLRLLRSSAVDLCLDTGHLLIGGMHPLHLLDGFADRIGHVHLKDVRTAVAGPVATGRISYLDAVRQGLYTPLGAGDLDIAAIVAALEAVGYRGWYVLEQDCALDGEPPAGQGPIFDAGRSIDYLRTASGA